LESRKEEPPERDPQDVYKVSARWEQELDRAGIAKAVFFTNMEHDDEIGRFIALKPERFIGYGTFNPVLAGKAELLKSQIETDRITGLKLYPMAQGFRVNDPDCLPVFKICQEKSLAVVIHFGLSINATHDLSFGNPLDLSTPALMFPSVRWIIPHFGAGFFREALLVAAQYRNVFIDTSSSNNWIRYSAAELSERDLFRRTYEALGPKKIVFGTDSSFFPRGYRRERLEQQLALCNDLGCSELELDDIFCRNIERILGL
jgi:predicted TIM-barrel fold metal-dependent hydrolase